MLEAILKTIKRSALVAGLYMGMAGAGCDCSSGVPGAGREGCVDKDNDTFYSQVDCGSEVDCDDNNNAIFPGATEFCDYKDNNCNGEADEGEGIAKTYCADNDEDGYGDPAKIKKSCFNIEDAPDPTELDGYVSNCTDCDDADPTKWELVDGYADNDGDKYATGDLAKFCSGDLPVGYTPLPLGADCDDSNTDVHPGAPELCDAFDQDCDGNSYNGFNIGELCDKGVGECVNTGTYECAPDGLGIICNAVEGVPENELCDGLDNDCNGLVDDDLISPSQPCSAGVGECETFGLEYKVCIGANGWSSIYLNCDAVPGQSQVEQCDGLDNDCDGEIDGFTQSVDCPISTEVYSPVYTQECVGGEWFDVNIEDCPECLPGTQEEQCCGYDGLGIRQRFCLFEGEWTDWSDCSIDNFVNVSNHPAADNQPSIDGDNVIFTSTRIAGYTQIFHADTFGMGPYDPSCVSCNKPAPYCITDDPGCGIGGPEWDFAWCYDGSLSDGKAIFECTWREIDGWFCPSYEDYDGFVYLLDLTNPTDGFLSMRCSVNTLFNTPSIRGNKIVVQRHDNAHIQKYEYTNPNIVLLQDYGFGTSFPTFPDISENYVAFATTVDPPNNISRIHLGTMNDQLLISGTELSDDGYQPAIHENDVVFTSQSGGVKRLRHYDIGTGTLNSLTTAACGNNYEPDVHGRKVAFTSERNGNKEVYVCDLEQTLDCCAGATNISNNSAADYDPSISTCKVAYVTEQTTDKEIFVYDLCEGGCGGE